MKFHGIAMQGNFICLSVDNIGALGAAGTKGKIIYVESENAIYVDTGTEWLKAGLDLALFGNNTILGSVTAETPVPISASVNTVIGRMNVGNVKALSTIELTSLMTAATTTSAGSITLATSAEAITGTNPNKSITPYTMTRALSSLSGPISASTISAGSLTAGSLSASNITITTGASAGAFFTSDFAGHGSWGAIPASGSNAPGTKLYFYQNIAPTGWTIDAAVADVCLAVKGGANAFNVNGGNLSGTWTQPNHTHTTGDHTLTIAEMPTHNHILQAWMQTGASHTASTGAYTFDVGGTTSQTGGGGAHNHGATGNGAAAITYRPYSAVGIICTKN